MVESRALSLRDIEMSQQTLDAIIRLIECDPHSAPALTLYALVSTLEFEKAGYLFKLDKLKDLNESQRQLAYQLIEMMVGGNIGDQDWQEAKVRMDELVRGA
jgi:hypothetical protein